MKEGEKREALLQKILGRIRQAADIRYDIVSNGWYAAASEGGEICRADFASWFILKVLRISDTLDYWQTTGTAGDHMVRTPAGTGYGYTTVGSLGFRKNQCPEMLLQKCLDFRDSTGIRILSSGAGSTKSSFTGTVRHLWLCWKCSENAGIRRWCPTPWNSGARRFQRPETRPFTTKTYGTTKRISSSRNAGTLLWRIILITAVKFYSKMKTPTQKHYFGNDSSLLSSKYRLVNPNLR